MSILASTLTACFLSACSAEVGQQLDVFLSKEDDFRIQYIHRLPSEANWPFTVDKGMLLCAWLLGEEAVYFAAGVSEFGFADNVDAESALRVVILSDNPIELAFSNFINADLFVEREDPIGRLEMVIPYYETGKQLCHQPKGTALPSGEL